MRVTDARASQQRKCMLEVQMNSILKSDQGESQHCFELGSMGYLGSYLYQSLLQSGLGRIFFLFLFFHS